MNNAVDVEVEGVDGSIWHLYGHREGCLLYTSDAADE